MNKRILSGFLILIMVLSLGLCACKKHEQVYKLYYLDINKSSLVDVDYEAKSTDTEDLIEELLHQLAAEQDSTEYMKTIPANISLRNYKLKDGKLTLDFSYQYNDMTGLKEVLVRSAICKSLLQIKGVDSITFKVSGQPLLDASGNVISSMTKDSFLDYSAKDKSNMAETKLVLYYASEDGNYLVKETREVSYNKNIALEKLVLDYLQKTPQNKKSQTALPKNTKVKSVTVSDGICYVTLDASMLSQMNQVATQTMIYSLVNSLCELDNINKVSIAIENNQADLIANSIKIEGVYEANMELVK